MIEKLMLDIKIPLFKKLHKPYLLVFNLNRTKSPCYKQTNQPYYFNKVIRFLNWQYFFLLRFEIKNKVKIYFKLI